MSLSTWWLYYRDTPGGTRLLNFYGFFRWWGKKREQRNAMRILRDRLVREQKERWS